MTRTGRSVVYSEPNSPFEVRDVHPGEVLHLHLHLLNAVLFIGST
jgi:hypothetical protein